MHHGGSDGWWTRLAEDDSWFLVGGNNLLDLLQWTWPPAMLDPESTNATKEVQVGTLVLVLYAFGAII